ncbi:MAG: DUF2877 domain-containing protein [Chloroflexi bacterium]|nr:DUF2877 domain-containing protein [Chloroflexota bacterium]
MGVGGGGRVPADAQLGMQPSSVFTQLGTTARECLTDGQRGGVLAVFSKVIYLLTEADELFWITTGDALMHRRCAKISAPLPGLVAGSRFHVQNHRLTVDPDFIFDFDSASAWNAPRPTHFLDSSALPDRILSFFSHLDLSQAKGFGTFIPSILSLAKNETLNSFSESFDPILRAAQPLVMDMSRACLEHQPMQIPSIAEKLIGLGAGLTPSGDDLLGGFLFAIHHLEASYPDLNLTDYKLQVESNRSKTPLISFTLLKDHAGGHAIEPLHHILNGILSSESFESISPPVLQLTEIGHSTGWDLLTGLLTGLLITIPTV